MAVSPNMYELTYIVNAVISDDQIKDIIKRVTAFVTEAGAEVVEVDEWGSRRLAYPIQKKRNGYYVNMYFRSSGEIIPKLERALEINDNILRYLTLRLDAKMIRYYENNHDSRERLAGRGTEEVGKDKDTPRKARKEVSKPAPVKIAAEPVAEAAAEPVAEAAAEPVAEETAEK